MESIICIGVLSTFSARVNFHTKYFFLRIDRCILYMSAGCICGEVVSALA
jgi:hypothetical protein